MNSQEARSILEGRRPKATSAQIAAAIEQADRDPELAKWWAHQKAFDARMVSAVKTIPVPEHLQASILEARQVVDLKPSADWRVRWALAASVVILASLAVLWFRRDTASVSAFRKEIAESGWNNSGHVGFASSDLKQVQQWLKNEKGPGDFTLPAAVQDLRVHGARIVDWRGRKVSLVCFLNEGRHLHLFVVDAQALGDLVPDHTPEFEKCSGWKTVCWSHGTKTYLLTGMNYLTFIKKSRKGGQWSVTG